MHRFFACATPSVSAIIMGLLMTGWGIVGFIWREPMYRSWARFSPFVREGGCLYEVNRLVAFYVTVPAFVLGGLVLAGDGLVGAIC
jgi:hypothetical protein